ncbi:hypothetical protein ACOMHN_048711 [Nucella lapillus]
MYETLSGLLVNYPELLEDFAGFLQPGQALQMRCHVANQLMHDTRAFLRKLELHYGLKGTRYARILRTIGRWDFKNSSPGRLRELLLPLLGTTVPQHLHDDFVHFFPDVAPPESHMEARDFEDIPLRDSDDEGNRSPDDFEDITFPDESDPYRTRRCPCVCHKSSFSKRKKKEKYTHCYRCCLKVVEGQLYFQPSNVTTRRPVSATFYNPVPMPLPPDPAPPFARSRGAFHRSAILDEVDDDDHDDDMEDDIELDEDDAQPDTEDDKGTEDEKPETEEEDEKQDTEDDDEDEDDEDFEEEEDEEELTEEEETCTPAKQRRTADGKDVDFSRTAVGSVKETLQPPSVDVGSQLSPTQRPLLRQLESPQSLSPQQKTAQSSDQHKTEQHSSAQRALLQEPLNLSLTQQPTTQHALNSAAQQSLAQHSVAQHTATQQQHPVAQQTLIRQQVAQVLAQHHVTNELLAQTQAPGGVAPQSVVTRQPPQPGGCGMEDGVVQPLTGRRPVSPSLPAATGLISKRIRMPKPGESNIRMRKRVLSMQPGRQVSASMQSLAHKSGLPPKADATPQLQSASSSQGLNPAVNPLLIPPSRAASSARKPPRVVSNKNMGTVSVGLGCWGGEGRDDEGVGGGGKGREEQSSLPTITSPHKNMQRGSFAGLLQGAQSSASNQPPLLLSSAASPEPVPSASLESVSSVECGPASVEFGQGSDSLAPAPSSSSSTTAIPLLSEDSLSAMFGQMREGGQNSDAASVSFDVHSNSSMSAMLSKMMQYTEDQQQGGAADSPKPSAEVVFSSAPQSLDHWVSSSPSPSSSSSNLQPARPQGQASQETVQWTSEQDRLIVETVRDHGATVNTFSQVAAWLGVTPAQVSQRVSVLMEFLDVPNEEATEEDI